MATTLKELLVSIGFDVDDKELSKIDKGFSQIKKATTMATYAVIGSGGLAAGLGFLVKKAGDMEQIDIAFETMLGGAKKAKDLLSDLFLFAQKTPFEIPGLLMNTKLLLGMGIESKDMIETLTNLGNVAAGLSIPLERLALNYGQVKAQTKLTGRELRDFAIAGVPLLKTLAEMLGKTEAAITDMVSKGGIGFKKVEAAFKRMAGEGGRFNNLMQKQSKSLWGIWSNIKDAVNILAMELGGNLLPNAKKVQMEFLNFLEVNRDLIKLKLTLFLTDLSRGLYNLFINLKNVAVKLTEIVDLFGGFEKVIKVAGIALSSMIGFYILSALGNLIVGFTYLLTLIEATGFAAVMTNIKILLLPALIGAAFVALGLILEDVLSYFQGKNSITGVIIEYFEQKFPNVFKIASSAFLAMSETMQQVADFLGQVFSGLWESIKGIFHWDVTQIKNGLLQIQDAFLGVWTKIKEEYLIIFDVIKNSVLKINDFLFPIFDKIGSLISKTKGLFTDEKEGNINVTRKNINLENIGVTGLNPSAAHVKNINSSSSSSQITNNIDAPITVNVPAGTDPAQVGEVVKESFREELNNIFRNTYLNLQPQVE